MKKKKRERSLESLESEKRIKSRSFDYKTEIAENCCGHGSKKALPGSLDAGRGRRMGDGGKSSRGDPRAVCMYSCELR